MVIMLNKANGKFRTLPKVFMNFTRYSYVDFVTLTAQGTGTSECAVVQSKLILVMRV